MVCVWCRAFAGACSAFRDLKRQEEERSRAGAAYQASQAMAPIVHGTAVRMAHQENLTDAIATYLEAHGAAPFVRPPLPAAAPGGPPAAVVPGHTLHGAFSRATELETDALGRFAGPSLAKQLLEGLRIARGAADALFPGTGVTPLLSELLSRTEETQMLDWGEVPGGAKVRDPLL